MRNRSSMGLCVIKRPSVFYNYIQGGSEMANKFNLNPRITHTERQDLVTNPEGGEVFKTPVDVSLFLVGSAFRIRNSFYYSAQETLAALESLIDETDDPEYNLAVAKFLSEILGIRLAPVVITTREAMLTGEPRVRQMVKNVVPAIFDRPDKIANALAYAEYVNGTAKALPPYYKKALRNALERFNAYTLKKFKLARRKVSLADVIKILRPRPKNDAMSALYKAILENSSEAAIEEGTVITEVLSDIKKSTKEKKAWIGSNLERLPFNALIRNLTNVDATDENLAVLAERFTKGLRVVNGLPAVKVANPFDLLTAARNSGNHKIMEVADLALGEFVSKVDLGLDGADVSVLIDISGSMSGNGRVVAADYMAMLIPMLLESNLKMYAFDTRVFDRTKSVAQYKRLAHVPSALRDLVYRDFEPYGGTSLADAVRRVSSQDDPDLLIVISDEVSWADNQYTRVNIFDVGVNIIAINPAPQGKFTVFDPRKPIVRLSSLDAKIFYYIPMLTNFKKFKEFLTEWAFGRGES